MELSPQKVRSMSFTTVKKGYDKSEVDAFVSEVATALETAQNETTAMEARARAAIARLKEVSQPPTAAPATPPTEADEQAAPAPPPPVMTEDAETISRTLLLAQRTADATVADATAQAESVISEAREEADKMVSEARVQARLALEEDRLTAENEVNELRGRRDVLESDVEHLEEFLIAQRERLRGAASTLVDIADRVPDGLGQIRRPLLSATDAEPGSPDVPGDEADIDEADAAPTGQDNGGAPAEATDDAADETRELTDDELRAAAEAASAEQPDASDDDAPVEGTTAPFSFGLATEETRAEGPS